MATMVPRSTKPAAIKANRRRRFGRYGLLTISLIMNLILLMRLYDLV